MLHAPVDRRGFLQTAAALAAAGVAPPAAARAQSAGGALTVKSVERLAGTSASYAYAVRAGRFLFLTGHEAFDFEKGLAPEVEGPAGSPWSGRPPLRREADYVLRRMRAILGELGSDLPNAVRLDQYYTSGAAVSAYHLARFAEFGAYIPPSTSIIMERCFSARANTHASMIAFVPGPGWTLERVTLPGEPISASGYTPAVVVNDFVFVAGNQALQQNGRLAPGVEVPAVSRWQGETSFRRQVHYVINERLAPSLAAAGSSLAQSLKAQAYVRGVENVPDFLDVWTQYFRDIPCAITVAPAKDYSSSESSLEINLIALRNDAARRKQVVETGIPSAATYGPCVRAGELVFPSGVMAVGRDGIVPSVANAAALDGLSLRGQAQGGLVLSYAEAVCKAVGRTMRDVVRAQYFLTDIRDFAGVSAAWSDRYGRQPHPFGAVQVPGPLAPTGASVIADFWIYGG